MNAMITIVPMTRELAHRVFCGCESDPMTYSDGAQFEPFVYSEEWVEEYFEKQNRLGHILFAIMLEDVPIGEVKLYNISMRQRKCELSMHIKCDAYKNRGYGTEALMQAVAYVRENLPVDVIEARTILKNERSCRVLKNAGFIESYRKRDTVYFEKELNKSYDVRPFELVPMTRELYHEFYRGFRTDIPPKGERWCYTPYVYDAEWVDAVYDLSAMLKRVTFAIIIDGASVGNVELRAINYDEGRCDIYCEMQSKDYKNRGYGKGAIIEMLKYAGNELGLKRVYADIAIDNTHARYVFENIGFVAKRKANEYMQYEILL